MKRKRTDPPTAGRKRRKFTKASELEKPNPVKKDVKLTGKRKLKLKIREQQICIRQKNEERDQLLADIKRLQIISTEKGHTLGVIDRHWSQLGLDLELIILQLGESVPDESMESMFLKLPSLTTNVQLDDEENALDDESLKEIEQRIKKTKNCIEKVRNIVLQVFEHKKQIWKLVEQKESDLLNENITSENSNLRSKNQKLRKEIEKKHGEMSKWKKIIQDHETLATKAEERLEFLEVQNEGIVARYRSLLRDHLYLQKHLENKPVSPTANQSNSKEPAAQKPEEQSEELSSLLSEVGMGMEDVILQSQESQIENLTSELNSSKLEVQRLKNETLELRSQIDNLWKQFNGKELEARLQKSSGELADDQHSQLKATHQENLRILSSNHKRRVEDLEQRNEELAKQVIDLQTDLSILKSELQRNDVSGLKSLLESMNKRDVEQKKTIEKLRTDNNRMREQIGNRDLQELLKEHKANLKIAESEIKTLKALIKQPDIFTQAMYKSQINRLKHRAKSLEGEIYELKQNTQAKKLFALEKNMEVLGNSVDSSAREYAQLQKEKEVSEADLIKKFQNVTNKNMDLRNQNATYTHVFKKVNEEKLTLQQALDAQGNVQTKQKVVTNTLQEQLKQLASRNEQLRDTLNASQVTIQKQRENMVAMTHKFQEVRNTHQGDIELKDQCMKELNEKQETINRVEAQKKQYQEKFSIQRTRIQKMKQIIENKRGSGAKSDLEVQITEKQLEIARQRLSCNLCTTRRKSAIIIRCLHMFCRECIDKHFHSRNRRCPQCKHPFGRDDVKDVAFNFT